MVNTVCQVGCIAYPENISGYSGYDPEVSIRNSALTPGLDYSAYPRAYAVNFGINLGF